MGVIAVGAVHFSPECDVCDLPCGPGILYGILFKIADRNAIMNQIEPPTVLEGSSPFTVIGATQQHTFNEAGAKHLILDVGTPSGVEVASIAVNRNCPARKGRNGQAYDVKVQS